MGEDERIELDELDIEILSHLQDDGRKPFTQIAEATGVSVGTIHNRVSKMLSNKTLTIIGRVNPFHAGLHVFALIFIAVKPPQLLEEALEILRSFPEVSFLGVLTGDFDIHIDVMCRDNDHLFDLIRNRIHKIEGVVDTKTIQVLNIRQWSQPSIQLLRQQYLDD